MAAFDPRPKLERMARTITLAVLAAPYAAFAQQDSPPIADDALQKIVESIEEVQSQHGASSPDLIDPLTALSLSYEERGDHDLAVAVIERVTQILHINYGLHSLDEAPLMQQLIRIEETRGNAEAAWDREQALLALVRRHPSDLRTVPILHEIADKRMAMLARYRAGEFPPQIVLGCYYSEPRLDTLGRRSGCRAGSKGRVIAAITAEANAYRAEANAVVIRHELWIVLPCAKPQPPDIADGQLSRHEAKSAETQVARYLSAMSDYVSCIRVKHAHAQSTDAPSSEVSQLAADRNAAVAEMEQRRELYEERFGRIEDAACLGEVLLPATLRGTCG
jgi:hypothetical protein